MIRPLAVPFHLVPVIPFLLHLYYGTGAAVLLVGLAYIKVFKLRTELEEQVKKGGVRDEATVKAMKFWEKLTFLPE